MAVNHLTFQGRMVSDPAFGDTNSGVKYANFRLAWNKKIRDRESKCFLDCKAFSGTAQFMEQYMNRKGQEIIAEGELNTEEWEKDGQKRSKTVLIVNAVHFSGGRQDASAANDAPAGNNMAVNMTPVEVSTDELPF